MGRFVFLFTSMRASSFSPTSEFTGSSIEAKCEPLIKYKRSCETRMIEPVKSPYGVGGYCDMAIPPTRSHLLWLQEVMAWAFGTFLLTKSLGLVAMKLDFMKMEKLLEQQFCLLRETQCIPMLILDSCLDLSY